MQLMTWGVALVVSLGGMAHAAGGNKALDVAAQPAAQPMTKQGYDAAKKKIEAQYKADRKTCGTVKGLAREICKEEAEGKADAAKAELEAQYKPSPEASQHAKNVIADANYDVAKKKCEAKKGDAKDKCVGLAKLAREAAIRQAKVEKIEETGGPFGNGPSATKKQSKS